MDEVDDKGQRGEDKPSAVFTAEDREAIRKALPSRSNAFSDPCFDELMRVWLLRHAQATDRNEHKRKQQPRQLARDGQRSALDELIKGIEKVEQATLALANYYPGPERIVDALAPAHELPSESILGSRSHERAREELRAIYRSLERLCGAAQVARQGLSRPTGRSREQERRAALTDLAEIYAAASSEMPGDTALGPWPNFAREVTARAWPKAGRLTEHIREAARTVQRRRRKVDARKNTAGKEPAIQNVRVPPQSIAHHWRSPPYPSKGA